MTTTTAEPSIETPKNPKRPEDDPTHQEVFSFPCDICHCLKITRNKQVKWLHWNEGGEDHSIILCSPCRSSFNSPAETTETTEKEEKVPEKSETPEEPSKEIAEAAIKRCVNGKA